MTHVARQIRLWWLILQVCGLVVGVASRVVAYSSGTITSNFLRVGGCNSCHFGGIAPMVTLNGPSPVMPGSTNEYTVQIMNTGSQTFGGLDAYGPFGTLSTGGSNSSQTQARVGANGLNEITHVGKKASSGGATMFSFMWTAPGSFTSATLQVWGNAVDGNGNAAGDLSTLASLTVMSTDPQPNPTDTPTPPPPGSTPTFTATPTSIPTATPILPLRDSVVSQVKPLNVTIRSGKTSMTKTLSVKVTNAEPSTDKTGRTLVLTPSSDCPAGVSIATPDFGTAPAGSVVLAGGKSKPGKVSVTVASGAFIPLNHVAPSRCTLTFVVSSPGSNDPTPSNNSVTMELNVSDKNQPDQVTVDESFIQSIVPVVVTIPKFSALVAKTVKPAVGNADILPVPQNPGDQITVTASDGDCPLGLVGTVDFHTVPANQVIVKGGKKQTGSLTLAINAATFATSNAKSPARCTALLIASGPTDSDGDPSNNLTRLVIDVVDKNDL